MPRVSTPVGLIKEAKAANDDEEEDTPHKVDDELQLRNAAANNVVEKDARDDDGITDNYSLQKIAKRLTKKCTFKIDKSCPYHAKGVTNTRP